LPIGQAVQETLALRQDFIQGRQKRVAVRHPISGPLLAGTWIMPFNGLRE
jgi:hypothetical protein